MSQLISRRGILRNAAVSSLGLAGLPLWMAATRAAAQEAERNFSTLQSNGNIRHSVAQWTYNFMPLEQLCLSTQCGFASTEVGNAITFDDQRRKLELVVTTAQEVWGTSA